LVESLGMPQTVEDNCSTLQLFYIVEQLSSTA
jgi:hypothetical protein